MKNMVMPLSKLTGILYRYTQAYANETLEKYGLSSGTYPFLLVLDRNEGTNQKQLSMELGVDKALSARAVGHLIKLGYIERKEDPGDLRSGRLFLSDRAKEIIPEVRAALQKWNNFIMQDLSEPEIEQMLSALDKVLENAKKYHKGRRTKNGTNSSNNL